jgi:hypothetical protein
MKNLYQLLTNPGKDQFFAALSESRFANLESDILTIFEGELEERRPYIIFDTLQVSPALCKSIREAAESFWSMATSTAKIFQFLSEAEILDWGFPEDYIPQILANTDRNAVRYSR